jgi:micrococcal nuclease
MCLYTYKFTLDRVVDGDTVMGRVDLGFNLGADVRVRLEGYDSAETWRPASVEEEKAGRVVKAHLVDMLKEEELILKSHKLDIYNRPIGELYIGDQSVNDLMKTFITVNKLEKARFRP